MLDRDSRLLRSRRRVARMLLVLAFVFALCWLPYNLLNLVFDSLDDSLRPFVGKNVRRPTTTTTGETFIFIVFSFFLAGDAVHAAAGTRQFGGQSAALLFPVAQHPPVSVDPPAASAADDDDAQQRLEAAAALRPPPLPRPVSSDVDDDVAFSFGSRSEGEPPIYECADARRMRNGILAIDLSARGRQWDGLFPYSNFASTSSNLRSLREYLVRFGAHFVFLDLILLELRL